MWDAMAGVEMGPAHRVLLVEACRLADRLDRFDRVLSGGGWFFERPDDDGRVEIVIDSVLSEARQYASVLKQMVAQLEPKPSVATDRKPVAPRPGKGITDLSAKIAARRGGVG